MPFIFFLGALRDATAGRITVVAPYLCYSRKDRKTKARDPVTTKYLARLFDAMKIDAIMTMDVHNLQAFQNSYHCLTEHLEAKNLFVKYFAHKLRGESILVMSPDFGGAKRAEQFRESLEKELKNEIGFGLMEKSRSKGIVKGDKVTGELEGKSIILIDDLIGSGGTLLRAAEACQQRGAKAIYAVATHGTFSQDAQHNLDQPAFEEIVITDSIPHLNLDPTFVQKKIHVISISTLLAKAILCMHTGDSIVELLGHE
ncbi:ribose-phosphate diphosphokinase [Echinicola jeungdonensis]|nr:ribose-phosphate diphosphokinase [Echinicola jeungdonensis]MDN3668096.1 ribose-phosphate diphosphokinase [Echinicola jeungdonensis]